MVTNFISFLIVVGLIVFSFMFFKTNSPKDPENYKDAKYQIGTHYFGYDAFGDLNNDGKEDVVFLLTDDSIGSGTFYYVVAAFKTDTGYVGSNALLLGDRITPQSIEIHSSDEITVNYSDRLPTDPMTTPPHVGVSRHFKIAGGKLVEKDSNVIQNDKMSESVAVEMYIRENIKTLAPENPVLGGSWYIVSVDVNPIKKTGVMIYEDGHIQGKASFSYTYDGHSMIISDIKKQ